MLTNFAVRCTFSQVTVQFFDFFLVCQIKIKMFSIV